MDLKGYLSNFYVSYYYGSLFHGNANWKSYNEILQQNKVYYILDGECEIVIEGEVYHGTPGMMFLIPKGVCHSFYHINENFITKYWFHFDLQTGGTDLLNSIHFPYCVDIGNNETIKQYFEQILTHASEHNIISELYMKSSILGLLAEYLKLANADSELFIPKTIEIGEITEYINAHIGGKVNLNELAEMAHMHPNYFIRFFREQTGTTPIKYINRRKMEEAKSMLENSDLPVSEIMNIVGFTDSGHFSKFFKSYTGYSPKQFRKIYKNSNVTKKKEK